MLPTEPIRPLQDVWLRPRRVFREMAAQPVGILDFLLAAAQGVGNLLALNRAQGAGEHAHVEAILANCFAYGAVAGMAGVMLMGVIYARLAKRMGAKSTTSQTIHVLAYGSVPMAVSLVIWVVTALLAGEAAFVETPRADLEGFLLLLLRLQFISYVLLLVWSIVLQVMGFSEIQGFTVRKAFGVWLLGQLVGFMASLFLALLFEWLFPGALLHMVPQS